MNPWIWGTLVAGLLAFLLLWWFYGLGHAIRSERAHESFRLQHERLAKLFLEAAAATGLPRGMRWVSCEFEATAEFARERRTRRIVALVGVTVQFEAIPGSDMEGLPAAGLPRQGTALMFFERGDWATGGRVFFNLAPIDVLAQHKQEYERLPAHRRSG